MAIDTMGWIFSQTKTEYIDHIGNYEGLRRFIWAFSIRKFHKLCIVILEKPKETRETINDNCSMVSIIDLEKYYNRITARTNKINLVGWK